MGQQSNSQKIKRAFAKMRFNKDVYVENCMVHLLETALEFAMQVHQDADKNLHLVTGGDYGWALVHNGKMVDSYVLSGEDMKGTAWRHLQNITSHVQDSGWVGVLMAGMEANHYETRFEYGVLQADFRWTAERFRKEFKEMKII